MLNKGKALLPSVADTEEEELESGLLDPPVRTPRTYADELAQSP